MKLVIIFLIILAIVAYIMVWIIIDMRTHLDPRVNELNNYLKQARFVSPLLDEVTIKTKELKCAQPMKVKCFRSEIK